jgi:two-component system sensor histidine kinase/response regulator
MPSASDIDALKARIAHLEDNRRYIQNALEMVLSLEDFYTEIGGDSHTLGTLLPEAKRRIHTIIPFDVQAFYMVDDADFSFRPAFLYPARMAHGIRQEVDFMIDEGYFAWAIRERRGVTISSKDHSRKYLLHVIANHNQIKGMFGGLLPAGYSALPDAAMTLLSIILLHVANAAESMAYTDLLKNQSLLLESQVAERTRELTVSQQELESAIGRANALAKEAQAASQAKGDFLAKMSHELRTPLNGIIGMTEVALSTELDNSQRRIVEIIGRESYSLLRQINEVLDFTKIEAGKLELEQIDFNLRTLMEEVGESFVFQTTEKGIEFNVFIDPTVPGTLIGDPVRLRQILLNLTGNAVKFTHAGEILIEAQVERQSGDRAVIRFAVVDTGIGIEADKVDRVFSSFSQADNSTTRQYGGTGLGTTISKQLVELMGGQIGIESCFGKGSTFWFTADFGVPAACQKAEVETDRKEERPTLLVVDNNATTCRILSTYLNQLGISAVTASDDAAALAVLNKRADSSLPIRAIITATRPSAVNGRSLQDHIRRIPCYAKTPMILTTSLKAVVTGEDSASLGFDGILAKPVKIGELKTIVEQVTGHAHLDPGPLPKRSAPIAANFVPKDRRPCHRGHILVADDYLVNQQVAYMHLTAVGFSVDLVENGKRAVEAFGRTAYDIIFMDVQMPVLNGLDATQRIREIEAARGDGRHIPIIALTANAMKGDEEKCLNGGMDGYLIKPVHRHQLIKTAQQWIELHGERDNPQGTPKISEASNQPADADVVAMDVATAVDEFGDADTVKMVAGQLIENVTSQLRTIREAIANLDRERIRKESHAIKGGAATLEAAPLSNAAAHLEKISLEAKPVDLNAAYHDLENQFFLFREFVSQWKGR